MNKVYDLTITFLLAYAHYNIILYIVQRDNIGAIVGAALGIIVAMLTISIVITVVILLIRFR